MHFPCFRFSPYFQEIFRIFGKFFKFYLFPKNFPFSSARISDDLFFSHRPQMLNFPPILPVLEHFPPDSRQFIISPSFLHTLRVFPPLLFPWCIYASPNARTGRPCKKAYLIMRCLSIDDAAEQLLVKDLLKVRCLYISLVIALVEARTCPHCVQSA